MWPGNAVIGAEVTTYKVRIREDPSCCSEVLAESAAIAAERAALAITGGRYVDMPDICVLLSGTWRWYRWDGERMVRADRAKR